MEELSLDNIMNVDDVELFSSYEETADETEHNDSEDTNDEDITETQEDFEEGDLFESESVGNEELQEDKKESTETVKSSDSPNKNLYSSFATALKEEGVFPDLLDEDASEISDADVELLNNFCSGWNRGQNNLASSKYLSYGATCGIKDYLKEINQISVTSGNPKYASEWSIETSGETNCLLKSWISGKFLSNAICNEWISELWNRNDNINNRNGDASNWSFVNHEALAEKEWPELITGAGTLRMAIPYFRNMFKVEGLNSILKCFIGSKEEYLLLIEGLDSIKAAVALLRGEDEEGTIIQSINELMADTEHYILTSTWLNVTQQTGQELGNIFAPVSILPIKPTNDGENTALAIDNSEILTFAFSVNTVYQTSFNSIPFIEI